MENYNENKVQLTDLITTSAFQRMQDTLAASTGMAVHIVDGAGIPITAPTPKRVYAKTVSAQLCMNVSENLKNAAVCLPILLRENSLIFTGAKSVLCLFQRR